MSQRHGYTNRTVRDGGIVTKSYQGPDATVRRDQAIDATDVLPARPGQVLVHGDYGPNNLLLDPVTEQVTAVVDWEWAHAGDPIENLAWCEWIVRMHHPRHVDGLGRAVRRVRPTPTVVRAATDDGRAPSGADRLQ